MIGVLLKEQNLTPNSTPEEVSEATDLIQKEQRSELLFVWLYSEEFLDRFKKVEDKVEYIKATKMDEKKENEYIRAEEGNDPDQSTTSPRGDSEKDEPVKENSEPSKGTTSADSSLVQEPQETKVDRVFDVLLKQIETKDKQITDLIARLSETNANLNLSVRRLNPPSENGEDL